VKIILCALADGLAEAVLRSLPEVPEAFLTAPDVSNTLRLMDAECPAIVIVGGPSTKAVADSCRQLRSVAARREVIVVAVASDRPEDVRLVLDAGADDFVVESLGESALRNRLRMAHRAATGLAVLREENDDRNQFRRLSGQLLCVAGLDGHFQMVNAAWTQILGWSSAELMSKPWLEFVHPDDREATARVRSELSASRPVLGFVHRYRCKDGFYRWLAWHAALLVERGVIYAVVNDVTEAKATTERLRESSESLSTTLDSIGDGVIATDPAGAITRMNPVAERLAGWAFLEAKGKSLREVLPLLNSDTRVKVENPVDRALREATAVSLPNRTVLARRDGTEIPIADSCAPIRTADGTVSGAVLVFRDLTAKRDAEVTQAKLQRQLVFADRMAAVGTLAAGAAHEINNPLSFAAANVDMAIEEIRATDGGSSPVRTKRLEEMLLEAREGIARVAKIVGALKTFSRVEEERPSVIDIVPVMDLAINMAFNEMRHRARLVKDYGTVPLVTADDARLGQVFINLLVNAAHAFPEGRIDANEIRVVLSTDLDGRAVAEVRDTGSGISPALLDRIFEPFFTTKSMGSGTGLGLAISHNIVTGMGGEISVHSELGRGTTFRVVLPASAPVAPSVAAPRSHSRPASAQSATVLVVDDEPGIGAAIRRVLSRHDVTVVTSAQDALDVLASGKDFNVVLSDLMMPGMSGMEMYGEIEKRYPEMTSRVVFLTGGAFTSEAKAFLDRVDNERMAKPFDYHKLRAMVQRFSEPILAPERALVTL
jgi:two-component system NtrC family sensor kinase